MIPYEQALAIVMNSAYSLAVEPVRLNCALGRVLANDIRSDTDMPPFNKSAMDGYACRKADLQNPLRVIEIIAAGSVPVKKVGKNECAKIMTGAIVPRGADCVVMVENTGSMAENKIVVNRITDSDNICYRGEDIKYGEVVLCSGTLLQPQHIAVLASAGIIEVPVYKKPRVAVIATGNELKEPGEELTPGSIRNSNSCQLIGQVQRLFIDPEYLGIADDGNDSLDRLIRRALKKNNVLIISGGVSMGDYDLVPAVLKRNGVELLFDRVAMQPGKPLTFGIKGKTAVFAFPGNPVSAFLSFELLARPFIYKLMGHEYRQRTYPLYAGKRFLRRSGERRAFIPVQIENGKVFPVEFHGSAHINALCSVDGFVSLPEGVLEIKKGEMVDFISL